jgi:hypothetical protein
MPEDCWIGSDSGERTHVFTDRLVSEGSVTKLCYLLTS